jgi:hypothetical protein
MKLPRRRNQRKDAAGAAGAADKDADADADADVGDDNNLYGDSKFLAMRDSTIKNLRSSEKDTKHKIIEKMVALQHNMKYNRHLLSVYMKAKELFDKMIEEHRMQIQSLEEIHRHLNDLIRENLSAKRIKSKKDAAAGASYSPSTMTELMKDKKRIGALLKKMRDSYEKLMNVDTVIGVTIQQINEITFMDDEKDIGYDTDGENDEGEDDEGEDADEEDDEGEDDDTDGDEGEGEGEGDDTDSEDDDTDGDDTDSEDDEDDDTDSEDDEDEDNEGEDEDEEDVTEDDGEGETEDGEDDESESGESVGSVGSDDGEDNHRQDNAVIDVF